MHVTFDPYNLEEAAGQYKVELAMSRLVLTVELGIAMVHPNSCM